MSIHLDINYFETGDGSGEPSPYLIKRESRENRAWNPDYDQDAKCQCGHPYHRHFDGYEDNAAVGCKYCMCWEFKKAQ